MRRPVALALLLLGLTGAAQAKGAKVDELPRRSTDLPRPRDGNIAIRGELDEARRLGTVEAYDRFIRRHPGHALAATARRERARLAR